MAGGGGGLQQAARLRQIARHLFTAQIRTPELEPGVVVAGFGAGAERLDLDSRLFGTGGFGPRGIGA
jgi:hypothetical protein